MRKRANRRFTRTLVLASSLLALSLAGAVSAQQPANENPSQNGIAVIEHDGWAMDLPDDKSLVVYVREVSTNLDGSWVIYTPFAREADGTLTALTPCDDVVVTCVPIHAAAEDAFAGARVGDTPALVADE